MTKYKVDDIIRYNSFGTIKEMIVDNVIDTNDGNPMYEDKQGNAVFESDVINPFPLSNAAWGNPTYIKDIKH